jgi:hypothetical protein
MKKTTITLTAALFMTATIFAQGADKDYSVKEGDWSIGINASPFLNYAGGFFSNAGAAAPTFNATAQSPASITGGYALSSDMTAFGVLTVGVTASTVNALDGTDADELSDTETKTSAATIRVVGGLTRRIGTGRLQGNFGGGVALGSSSNGGKTTITDIASNTETSTKTGSTINYGVVGVAGVEFFLCPQISLGAAYRIFAGGNSTGDDTSTIGGTTTTTTFGGSSAAVNTAGTGSLIMSFYLR